MTKKSTPITAAIRFLKNNRIDFEVYQYDYKEKGGTAQTARELNVNENSVIKTLVLEGDGEPFIMLMHGDKEVSLKQLARELKYKAVKQSDAKQATKATAYQFGGTSPFGTRNKLKIVVEETIFNLNSIYINGGKKGLIVKIEPKIIEKLFDIRKVAVKI